ncbi:MAG: hypothetical protein KatS3mg031_0340 [Chitinophagales bacterium]|nr:MAG: hypothetical protein KatS3mg031_0340 [Chitinophagales bacterium]
MVLCVTGMQACFSVKSTDSFVYIPYPPETYCRPLEESKDFYLIDVRTPAEYRKARIEGALNYNFLSFRLPGR